MSKLPKTLANLSNANLESLCVDCGLCCYASIPFGKSKVFVPELRCKYLSVDTNGVSKCLVYNERHEVAKKWCLPLNEAIQKGIFPNECPYVKSLKGYYGPIILADADYQLAKSYIKNQLKSQNKPDWLTKTRWNTFIGHTKE